MDDIQAYFSLQESDRLYSMGLALFQKYLAANNQRLSAQLSKGPIGRNQELLDAALAPLEGRVPSKPTPKPIIGNRDELVDETSLIKALKSLLQQRAKTSQKFHGCNSDEARAAVCDEIDAITLKVREAEGNLEYFRLHGRLPPPPTKEEDGGQLPGAIDALAKMRSQLASHRYKLENRVIELLELPANNRKRAQIPEKQQQLVAISEKLKRVKIRLKELRDAEKKAI